MRICVLAAFAMLSMGCAGVASRVIATYQGSDATKELQSCTLEFWWERPQLERLCGKPKWKVNWLGRASGSECWIYDNQAAADTRYYAVCLAPEEGKLRVKEAMGLRHPPVKEKKPEPVFKAPPPLPPPPPPVFDPNAAPPPEPPG